MSEAEKSSAEAPKDEAEDVGAGAKDEMEDSYRVDDAEDAPNEPTSAHDEIDSFERRLRGEAPPPRYAPGDKKDHAAAAKKPPARAAPVARPSRPPAHHSDSGKHRTEEEQEREDDINAVRSLGK